jgi:Ca2+-binding EF-hand superfamily protein
MNASCDVTVIHTYTTPGDVNNDDNINISDLMAVLNYVSGKSELVEDALTAADVNGDGVIDLQDLMRLLNYVSGKIKEL